MMKKKERRTKDDGPQGGEMRVKDAKEKRHGTRKTSRRFVHR